MILEKKLIEKQKNKKNTKENEEKQEDVEEEKIKNQSYMDSWKENKENNTRFKKPKYKSHNYNNNYNHSNKFFHHNKKHFKDYKNYKSPYNQQSNRNNYNINNINHKNNYIEKEIELNSKEEINSESEIKKPEPIEENSINGSIDSYSKNNLDFNSQENTEEISSLEHLNLNLMKSQSEELSHENIFNYHDIGIKLFPGVFKYNKKKSYEQNKYFNNINENINNNNFEEENKKVSDLDIIKTKNDFECDNYLCKVNSGNIKRNQKNGLALAFDYYASFLEDKIK